MDLPFFVPAGKQGVVGLFKGQGVRSFRRTGKAIPYGNGLQLRLQVFPPHGGSRVGRVLFPAKDNHDENLMP